MLEEKQFALHPGENRVNSQGMGKRKLEVKRKSREHEAVVRMQSERIQSGRKKDKRFKSEGRVQVLH